VVGGVDDVGVVLDDDDCGSLVYQGVEHSDELADLVHVQAGCGLVEDVESAGEISFAELAGYFDALGFAAGEGGGCLTELDVFETDLREDVETAHERRVVGEEFAGLTHGHVEDVGDAFTLIFDFEGLGVVALALAGLAGDVDVGQEMHLDANLAVALAGFAAAAFDVEGESTGLVASGAGLFGTGENLANLVEYLGVGGRVGTRRTTDGRLVDGDDFLYLFETVNAADLAGVVRFVSVEELDVLVERIHDEGGLART